MHCSIYFELFKNLADVAETMSSTLYSFITKCVTPLPELSDKAKKLTHAICEIIAKDIQPISIVNDVGFRYVLKEVEPSYVAPCHLTITRNTDDLYMSKKWRVMELVLNVEFVSCTTDL